MTRVGIPAARARVRPPHRGGFEITTRMAQIEPTGHDPVDERLEIGARTGDQDTGKQPRRSFTLCDRTPQGLAPPFGQRLRAVPVTARARPCTRRCASHPAATSARAQASAVAPVVRTSSTSTMCRLCTVAGDATANASRKVPAPFRAASRAARGWPAVGRVRARRLGARGGASARARRSAWLKPRSRSRCGCRGNGDEERIAAVGVAFGEKRPQVCATIRRRRYLSAWMATASALAPAGRGQVQCCRVGGW